MQRSRLWCMWLLTRPVVVCVLLGLCQCTARLRKLVAALSTQGTQLRLLSLPMKLPVSSTSACASCAVDPSRAKAACSWWQCFFSFGQSTRGAHVSCACTAGCMLWLIWVGGGDLQGNWAQAVTMHGVVYCAKGLLQLAILWRKHAGTQHWQARLACSWCRCLCTF